MNDVCECSKKEEVLPPNSSRKKSSSNFLISSSDDNLSESQYIKNSLPEDQQFDYDTLMIDNMYQHPTSPHVRGRPFSGIEDYRDLFLNYLESPNVSLNKNAKIYPQPITALSANHFPEHAISIQATLKTFQNPATPEHFKKILIYDLGLDPYHKMYFESNADIFDYRIFDISKYPVHTEKLLNMAFKIFLMADCLSEFGACMWFDTSVSIVWSPKELIDEYMYERGSSFLYFLNKAPGLAAAVTHPEMLAYIPSDISRLNKDDARMGQAGATIFYNTFEFKHKVMKYALACALTQECLHPNYELHPLVERPLDRVYKDTGYFDIHYCPSTSDKHQPFNCHRFDQSLFTVLLGNMYNFNQSYYKPYYGKELVLNKSADGVDVRQQERFVGRLCRLGGKDERTLDYALRKHIADQRGHRTVLKDGKRILKDGVFGGYDIKNVTSREYLKEHLTNYCDVFGYIDKNYGEY